LNNRLRGILLLMIGLVLIGAGVLAVLFLTQQTGILNISAPSSTSAAPTEVVVKNKVVVVTHDIKLGDLLKKEDVSLMDVPVDLIPRDSISNPADVVGKFSKVDLVQGEMLLQHNLADPTNVEGDLAFILSDDHVLMAIEIPDTMTAQSIPSRGDIVDVFVTISESVDSNGIPSYTNPEATATPGAGTGPVSPSGEKVTRPFTFDAFQNIGITAIVMDIITSPDQANAAQRVAQTTGPTPTPVPPTRQQKVIRAYLLALKPQDALVLKHLKDNGAIFDLVLRNPTSSQTFDLTPVTLEYIIELYGLQVLK
jgi:pilus assembly protein CpaB